MTDAEKIAQKILAELGKLRAGKLDRPERQSIALAELEPLARDYLAAKGAGGARLMDAGPVYVSLAAAREYARAESIVSGDEAARRELTELLVDAKQSTTDLAQWRFRRRADGVDITARVAREGRLLVVTSISVRDINVGGRRG